MCIVLLCFPAPAVLHSTEAKTCTDASIALLLSAASLCALQNAQEEGAPVAFRYLVEPTKRKVDWG